MLDKTNFNLSAQYSQKRVLSFGIKTTELKKIIKDHNLNIDLDVMKVPKSKHYHYPKATFISGFLMAGKANVKENFSNFIICALGKGKNTKKAFKNMYKKMAKSITSGCALVKGQKNELITYA